MPSRFGGPSRRMQRVVRFGIDQVVCSLVWVDAGVRRREPERHCCSWYPDRQGCQWLGRHEMVDYHRATVPTAETVVSLILWHSDMVENLAEKSWPRPQRQFHWSRHPPSRYVLPGPLEHPVPKPCQDRLRLTRVILAKPLQVS